MSEFEVEAKVVPNVNKREFERDIEKQLDSITQDIKFGVSGGGGNRASSGVGEDINESITDQTALIRRSLVPVLGSIATGVGVLNRRIGSFAEIQGRLTDSITDFIGRGGGGGGGGGSSLTEMGRRDAEENVGRIPSAGLLDFTGSLEDSLQKRTDNPMFGAQIIAEGMEGAFTQADIPRLERLQWATQVAQLEKLGEIEENTSLVEQVMDAITLGIVLVKDSILGIGSTIVGAIGGLPTVIAGAVALGLATLLANWQEAVDFFHDSVDTLGQAGDIMADALTGFSIPDLDWSTLIASPDWSASINTLAWADWVMNLNFDEYIPSKETITSDVKDIFDFNVEEAFKQKVVNPLISVVNGAIDLVNRLPGINIEQVGKLKTKDEKARQARRNTRQGIQVRRGNRPTGIAGPSDTPTGGPTARERRRSQTGSSADFGPINVTAELDGKDIERQIESEVKKQLRTLGGGAGGGL